VPKRKLLTPIEELLSYILEMPPSAKRRAENILSEVPDETLEAYQPHVVRDAIMDEDTAIALTPPQMFIDIAPKLSMSSVTDSPGRVGALRQILRGEAADRVPEQISSEGRSYANSYAPEYQPGFDEMQRLWFDPADPYALRTSAHEGRHRSIAMQEEGIPQILIRLNPEDWQEPSSRSYRREIQERAADPKTPIYTQKDHWLKKDPEFYKKAGALWKILSGAPVVAAGADYAAEE